MTKRNHNNASLDRLHEIFNEETAKLHDRHRQLTNIARNHYAKGVTWKTYENPQRDDGLFVAADLPLAYYRDADGNAVYHPTGGLWYKPTPDTQHAIHSQLPHADAAYVVRLLNRKTKPMKYATEAEARVTRRWCVLAAAILAVLAGGLLAV